MFCFPRTNNRVKHLKIYSFLKEAEERFYFSSSKHFNSIEELIAYYQKNNLREIFNDLDDYTILKWPYKQLITIAIKDFEPKEANHLRIKKNYEVIVIGQEGYRVDWWKGRCMNEVS